MPSEVVRYNGPIDGSTVDALFTEVSPSKGTKFPPVRTYDLGLIVSSDPNAKKAGIACWGHVVHALKWALERSPEMRRDVKKMIDDIENPEIDVHAGAVKVT